MPIKEMDPGERHTMPSTALRVSLTGTAQGATLRAVDRTGADLPGVVRLKTDQIILTPQPVRMRLVATPAGPGGAVFQGTATVGLTLHPEGAAGDQILVAAIDVGALREHEIAVLDFASDRTVLSVSGRSQQKQDHSPTTGFGPVLGGGGGIELGGSSAPRADTIDETLHPWVQRGRYAFRRAEQAGAIGPPPKSWGLVVDGSASMLALHQSGELLDLVVVVAGVVAQWTSQWPRTCLAAGVAVRAVPGADRDPALLVGPLFGDEPGSGSRLAEAVALHRAASTDGSASVVVTDGAPGDIALLLAGAIAHPGHRLVLVVVARSRFGLPADQSDLGWWNEELVALDELAALAQVTVVAVAPGEDGRLGLGDGERSAQLAGLVAQPSVDGGQS